MKEINMKTPMTRRQYLALTAAAAAGATLGAFPLNAAERKKQIIPKRVLGRTGVEVPILGFGTFPLSVRYRNRDDEAVQMLQHGIDLGISYIDTATSYGAGWAQKMVGRAIKNRRKEVFVATKIYGTFTYDEIMRNLEGTLERLQTDYVDLLYIHKLQSVEEADAFGKKGAILDTYYKLREQKVARFIGVSAHGDPIPVTLFIERHDLDCVLLALNAAMQGVVYDTGINSFKNDPTSRSSFETIALPAALKKNMGILAMKVSAQGQLIGSAPEKADMHTLLRYAWSLPIASSMVGMTSIAEIEQNVAWASAFQTMPPHEMRELSDRLSLANKLAIDSYFANHNDVC
ncbi:oxidoreductase [Bacteroidia bacterium]|nr:oxidoreductase [Bacteroidia bacterium]